ncbi:MAG: Gfo/Idh/MocA family oxidoreductase [Candidatus Latescibacteria bacterium]|nr:Gfo/Idh/MocA family oxidoreductase [Candidatus Latescibacterota bacterium]
MATRRLRLGLIGCGGLSNGVLLPALSVIDALDLVATCDLREDAARTAAERYKAQVWYTDYRQLLARDDLDAVMVVAPPAVHEAAGIAVLERGLHLYVEKPPAMTAAGARRLADAARDRPVKTMVGTVQRHVPVNRMAKAITERAEFGRVILYQARYCCPGPGMRMDWGMRRDDDADMVRFFMLDHLIHHIDLARYFLGEIVAVHTTRSATTGEQYALVFSLTFANGVAGSLTAGFRSPSFDNQVYLLGDGPASVQTSNWTRLIYHPPQPPVGQGGYSDHPAVTWDGGISYQNGVIRPGYREELELWARAILEDGDCHSTVEDGWRDMLVIDAMVESLNTGRTVEISDE